MIWLKTFYPLPLRALDKMIRSNTLLKMRGKIYHATSLVSRVFFFGMFTVALTRNQSIDSLKRMWNRLPAKSSAVWLTRLFSIEEEGPVLVVFAPQWSILQLLFPHHLFLHSPGSKSMEAAFFLSPSVFRISSINLFQFEPVVCTKALQCGCTPNIKLATEMLFQIQE